MDTFKERGGSLEGKPTDAPTPEAGGPPGQNVISASRSKELRKKKTQGQPEVVTISNEKKKKAGTNDISLQGKDASPKRGSNLTKRPTPPPWVGGNRLKSS